MKFGAVPPREAEGAIAVHSIRKAAGAQEGHADRHGRDRRARRPPASPRSWWRGSSRATSSEDVAAAEIAAAVAGEGVRVDRAFTGRANLFAEHAGVLVVDKAGDRRAQSRSTRRSRFATLPAYKPVVAGEMIATVKIIPFAVAGDGARPPRVAAARARKPLVRVAPYRIRKVGVVSTLLPGLADKVIEKTLKVTAERLAPAGATIVAERRVPHEPRRWRQALDEVLQGRRRAGHRVRRLRDRRPARRDPGGGRGDRRPHRAFRHAGRSRQPAAGRPRRTAGRCSARPAARARRRRTASTGC